MAAPQLRVDCEELGLRHPFVPPFIASQRFDRGDEKSAKHSHAGFSGMNSAIYREEPNAALDTASTNGDARGFDARQALYREMLTAALHGKASEYQQESMLARWSILGAAPFAEAAALT